MPLNVSVRSVIDSALSESDPNRIMTFEGTSEVLPYTRGVGVKGTMSDNFETSGFTHEVGPNIIFS